MQARQQASGFAQAAHLKKVVRKERSTLAARDVVVTGRPAVVGSAEAGWCCGQKEQVQVRACFRQLGPARAGT